MKAIKLIEKFEKFMDKISMPATIVCGAFLIGRVLVSFVFNV
jgi:hypothetical protein